MEASVQNKGILWLWGILALLIGGVIVVINNAWTSRLPLLVTIFGWIAMVKGAFIHIYPYLHSRGRCALWKVQQE
jgi:hypothetical protein